MYIVQKGKLKILAHFFFLILTMSLFIMEFLLANSL